MFFAMIILVASLDTQDALGTFGAGNYSSYINGSRWDFLVTRSDLEGSPRWRDTDDSPPLPPREAITSARRLLADMGLPGDRWHLGSVTLHNVLLPDAWIYVLEFQKEPSPPQPGGPGGAGVVGGPVETLRAVVLMNGRALVPRITDWPPPNRVTAPPLDR